METLAMIEQAFGDQILSLIQVYQWHARFKTGRTSVDEHKGRPTSCTTPETVARIQDLLRQDRHWTIHDVAEELGIGYGTCQWVLMKELGLNCVTAKFVPRFLTSSSSTSAQNFVRLPPTVKPLIWHPVTLYHFQK
jgi:hypothetical protein